MVRVTVDQHGEDFLHMVSYRVFIVHVGSRAKNAVQSLLLLVALHQVLHDLTDLDICWANHGVLGDVRRGLLLLLRDLRPSPALLVLLFRHIVFSVTNFKIKLYNQIIINQSVYILSNLTH